MLEKIRALAMEKLASQEEVDAFMEGFEKEAWNQLGLFGPTGMATRIMNHPDAGKVALGLGASLVGAAIVKGVSSGSRVIENAQLKSKFEASLQQVMASNKVVKGEAPQRVRHLAETMFNFAPHVVTDPNLLSNLLSNILQGDVGAGIDLKTVEMLVNLESRYVDARKTNPIPGIRA